MKLNTHIGNVGIKINTDRLDRNIRNGQKVLNEDVLRDTNYYFSKGGTGYLRASGHIPDPYGGEVVWDAPYSHFQYIGYVLTDENGRVFVGPKEEKPILTNRPLHYQEPGAEREPFEAAKRDHLDEWLADVRKEVGKG